MQAFHRTVRRIADRVAILSKPSRELWVIGFVSVLVFAISAWLDAFSWLIAWIHRHDTWQLDELFTTLLFLVIGLAIYSSRRWKELQEQIRQREKSQAENRRLTRTLEDTLAEVERLRIWLRMCSSCKRLMDNTGYWMVIETYLRANSGARIIEGLCPDCARKSYGSSREHLEYHAVGSRERTA